MIRPIGRWPYESRVHKNGDRFVGRQPVPVEPLYAAGTPPASIIVRSSVTALVRDVRVDDELEVERVGQHWLVSSDAGHRAALMG